MVKHPATMSNQRARGLGSLMAVVAIAIPVFADLALVFFEVTLVDFAAVFLGIVFFATVVFLEDVGVFAVTAPVAFTDASGALKMLAAPAVGSSVQLQMPLMSAQAWPDFAAP